jgi:hypothetical protein
MGCALKLELLKTLKISDRVHAKLTSVVGRLMAETGKMKTYSDATGAILNKPMVLSPDLLDQVEGFIKQNAQLGYNTKEEFVQGTVRIRLTSEEKQTSHNFKKGRTKP